MASPPLGLSSSEMRGHLRDQLTRWHNNSIAVKPILARYPNMQIVGDCRYVESPFINQLKTLPVRLHG